MTPAYQRCWTLGGVVYLLGLLIVLVAGGLRADEAYQVSYRPVSEAACPRHPGLRSRLTAAHCSAEQ